MKQLVRDVREERKPHVNCRSAKDGIDMNALLQEIVDKAVYKQDYEDITAKILFEEVPYETAAAALRRMMLAAFSSPANLNILMAGHQYVSCH